ncbi:hypothetical protein ACLM5J_13130 [Nocardioides sp. Bht2]|uniref:hypothetical protein n=1 Tax=Nocardioides sp. Bht2 TaxID=3392297 RepID=UPI0039B3E90F
MQTRLTRALVALTTAVGLGLTGLAIAPAQAATGSITGVALDAAGKPLPHVGWEIYIREGNSWSTLQFGPKLTDGNGRFTWTVPVGGQYRVCFNDDYYGPASTTTGFWQPEVRHRDTCWPNATSMESAQTWTSSPSTPSKTFTMKLPRQGLGMAPVDPFIIGSYEVGKPLTIVGQEGWRPTNATFSYQWYEQSSGTPTTPIPGATGATFTPTAAQSGKWVYARATASRTGYKPAQLTTPVSMVGTQHVQPSSPLQVTGTAAAGSTLTASFGKPGATYSELSWFVDGVPQPAFTTYDAATSSFPVTAAHAGTRIDARLKIYKKDGQGNYVDGSDSFARVQVQVAGTRPALPLPTAIVASGEPAVGRVLTAPASVTADPAATVRYQWLRGTSSIAGATKRSYRVQAADLGKKLHVRVTVSRPGWWGSYVKTSPGAVAKKALKKGTVKLVGTPRAGKRLTAKVGGWGPRPVTIRFQWLRNGKVIKGAKKSSYNISKKDRGKVIKVQITVKKTKYLTTTATSKGRKVKR